MEDENASRDADNNPETQDEDEDEEANPDENAVDNPDLEEDEEDGEPEDQDDPENLPDNDSEGDNKDEEDDNNDAEEEEPLEKEENINLESENPENDENDNENEEGDQNANPENPDKNGGEKQEETDPEDSENEEENPEAEKSGEDPPEPEPVLTKAQVMDHFIKYFQLKLFSNGQVQDENLLGLLQIICKLFKDHYPIILDLSSTFIKGNMDSSESAESPEGGISSSISDFLARFTGTDDIIDWDKYSTESEDNVENARESFLSTLLSEILTQVKDRFDEDGNGALKLLNSLSILVSGKIDLKICFFFFYGRQMETKDELSDILIEEMLRNLDSGDVNKEAEEEETEKQEVEESGDQEKEKRMEKDAEDLKKIELYLKILESYALLQLEKSEEDEIMGVDIPQIIRHGVKGHQKENGDWTGIFGLVELFKQKINVTSEFETYILNLHSTLSEFGWPEKSYRHSLYFAAVLNAWLRSQEEAKKMLKDVYNFFISMKSSDKQDWRDKEYFNLCKMALVHIQNEENEEFRQQGGMDVMMDNAGIFHEADYLNKINGLEFFDWVLNQAGQFKGNELVQHFAAQLLVIPVCVHEGVLDDSKNKQVINWVGEYRKMLVESGNEPTNKIFGLLETPLTVIKLAAQVLPSIRVIKMSIEIMNVFLEVEGVTKCSWFLQESFETQMSSKIEDNQLILQLYLVKPCPACVWESEHSLGDLVEMRGVCKVFVDQGLSSFIEMLKELEKMYTKDYYLDLHFLDFLETMKACAYFEECVKTLLKSKEFFSALQGIFHAVIDGIERNEDAENIKAVCHILVFWFALICNSENKKFGYEDLILERMLKFHRVLLDEESPVTIAFDAEKHWHIYFREQGDTGGKILDKYLETHDEESTGDIWDLARRLKDTISRKEGWWLVSQNVGKQSLAQMMDDS